MWKNTSENRRNRFPPEARGVRNGRQTRGQEMHQEVLKAEEVRARQGGGRKGMRERSWRFRINRTEQLITSHVMEGRKKPILSSYSQLASTYMTLSQVRKLRLKRLNNLPSVSLQSHRGRPQSLHSLDS